MAASALVLAAFLFLCLCLSPVPAAAGGNVDVKKIKGLTKFTLYLQEDPTSSFFVVQPLPGFQANFGALVVVDQRLTLEPDRNSTAVGNVKGLAVFSNNAALPAPELVYSAVFNDSRPGGFGKSTLSIRGFNELAAAERELSIVSGTGKFRLAQGWATYSTFFRDSVTRVGTQKIDFYVRVPRWAWIE